MSASKEEQAQQQAVEFKETLKEQGINADEVIALRDEYMQTMKSERWSDHHWVWWQEGSVPGFIVPLEFWRNDSNKFLLVPVAGACIHMPPPANQIVKVSFLKAFKLQNVQYPVWVEGDF